MTRRVSTKLRHFVARRASHRCEYGLIPEELVAGPFDVDHVTARKHGGTTTAANLAWSCGVCNCHKGSDLTSVDRVTKRIVRLFNPRRDNWRNHFRIEAGIIVPLSAIGRATVELLQFNELNRVEMRKALRRQRRYSDSS